jgi:hypothetical protein
MAIFEDCFAIATVLVARGYVAVIDCESAFE